MQMMGGAYRLIVFALIFALSTGAHALAVNNNSDTVNSCTSLNSVDVESAYLAGALEEAMICRSLGEIDVTKEKQLIHNRVLSFKSGNETAIREFDLTIDTYVLNTADEFELEVGQMLLQEIAVDKYDADGRYRFLLAVSYLNSNCDEYKSDVLKELGESTSVHNLLAAALLAYIYRDSYQCFEYDPVKSHALLKSYEENFGSKVSFEDAVKYMKSKGIIVSNKSEEI